MGTRTTIRAALETKLKTVSGLSTTVYQNINPIEPLAANNLLNVTLPVAYILADHTDQQRLERNSSLRLKIWNLKIYIITKGNSSALAAQALDDLIDAIDTMIVANIDLGLTSVVNTTDITAIDIWTDQSFLPYAAAILTINITYYE